MKNYITKETLPEILNDLAEEFFKNSSDIAVNVDLSMLHGNPTLRIEVSGSDRTETLAVSMYTIAEKVSDSFDVIDDTIDEAVAKLEDKHKAQ